MVLLLTLAAPAAAQEVPPGAGEPAAVDAPAEVPSTDPATDPATDPSTGPGEAAPSEVDRTYAALIDDALREFGAAHYREAADNFREALALRPSARVLRGLGKALFELGEYVEASTAFERSLVHPVDPLTDALREEVESLLARTERHIATLVIEVNVAEAEVLLDGRPIRPGPLRIDAGERRLEVRAAGYEPYDRTLRATTGERTTVRVELEPRARPPTTVVSPGPGVETWWGLSLGTVGLAGGIVSAAWLVDRLNTVATCEGTPGVVCGNLDEITGQRDAAAVVLGLAGASLITGTVLLFVGLGGSAEDEPATAFGCGATPAGGGCHVAGRF